MRSLVLLALPLIVACTTASPPPVSAGPHACQAEGLDRFIGQPANIDEATEIQRASGARTLRWTGPGIAVTMDLRSDRVNAELDQSHSRIVAISCG